MMYLKDSGEYSQWLLLSFGVGCLFSLLCYLLLSFVDCMPNICRTSAFLLFGRFCLDVPRRCATVSHAGWSFWKRIFKEEILQMLFNPQKMVGGEKYFPRFIWTQYSPDFVSENFIRRQNYRAISLMNIDSRSLTKYYIEYI